MELYRDYLQPRKAPTQKLSRRKGKVAETPAQYVFGRNQALDEGILRKPGSQGHLFLTFHQKSKLLNNIQKTMV